MTEITEELSQILKKHAAAPFLFVGSGFSRRYLGIPDWAGLLEHFCADLKPIKYYRSSADGDLPTAASLIAEDFHQMWWASEKTKKLQAEIDARDRSSALKYEISRYMAGFNLDPAMEKALQVELNTLRELTIDGIITTNWDHLLESVFPDYRVFIGQEELLFSSPTAIAEIYKIHGCSLRPHSLVLTSEDYKNFEKNNPYLAAKLITIFIEHPVIFIGYSLSDPHIQSILSSISACLDAKKLKIFSQNLIFVQRADGDTKEGISGHTFKEKDKQIGATVVTTNNFSEVYDAISVIKRKIPAKILRYCKEQIYEIARSPDLSGTIEVVDFEKLDSHSEIEFVVGLGVAEEKRKADSDGRSKSGYVGVKREDLLEDIIFDNKDFEPEHILTDALPVIAKSNARFIPIFKYLKAVGISSAEDLEASEFDCAREVARKMLEKGFTLPSYHNPFYANVDEKSTEEIIRDYEPGTAAIYIPYQSDELRKNQDIIEFLRTTKTDGMHSLHKNAVVKLICFYDYVTNGFDL